MPVYFIDSKDFIEYSNTTFLPNVGSRYSVADRFHSAAQLLGSKGSISISLKIVSFSPCILQEGYLTAAPSHIDDKSPEPMCPLKYSLAVPRQERLFWMTK